jgi:hypothetical protein
MGRLRLRRRSLWFSGTVSYFAVESAGFHGCDGFGIPHEGLPDEGGTKVLRHQQANSEVDAKDVGIVPVQFRVEGIAESVAAPGVLAIVVTQSAKDVDAFTRKEG